MRVVVAEDVMLTREGITRLLTDAGVDVTAAVGDAAALLRAVGATQPDAAIIDIRMPPTHTDEGLVAAQQIRVAHPSVGVLVLSQYVEPHYALRLLEDHPERTGYLLKERVFDVANLTDALRRLADGETVLDPTIVARLFSRKRRITGSACIPPRRPARRPGAPGPAVRHGDHPRPLMTAGGSASRCGHRPSAGPAHSPIIASHAQPLRASTNPWHATPCQHQAMRCRPRVPRPAVSNFGR